MNLIDIAFEYLDQGFSVIPVGRDKKPLIPWEKYQHQRATKEEVAGWYTRFPDAGIAIVTGVISGIVVIDVEAGGKTDDLSATVISCTGGGGWHFYCTHPGVPVKNAVRIREKTDIRGDGGYVVAPPSLHQSGKRYEWAVSPQDAGFADLPSWVMDSPSAPQIKINDWDTFLAKENPEGTRNEKATRVAGKLLAELSKDLWEGTGWLAFRAWNQEKNIPPLSDEELRAIWESIKNAESNKPKKSENQSKNLLDMIGDMGDGIELFHNELKEPFMRIRINDHYEIWSCKNKMLKRWLAKLFWDKHGKAPSTDALNTALNAIEGRACFGGQQHILWNRVALHEGILWYDLADPKWRAVKITTDGWQVDTPPILFIRHNHQQAQIDPAESGDVTAFLKFVNIKDESSKMLLLVTLIASFIPDFPHPVLVGYGSQGAAKSMCFKLLKRMIDPSSLMEMDLPNDKKELVQQLAHNWFIFYDNLSYLPDAISNTFCRAVTGSGFSKRQLFTDEDDVIFSFKRCIGLNGINLVIAREDMVERSILLQFERVADNERKSEEAIYEAFNREQPKILAGIFEVLTKAMTIKPMIVIPSLPRMADFTLWGCAITEALGQILEPAQERFNRRFTKERFLAAYYENIGRQNEEVLGDDLVAIAVRSFMDEHSFWEDTPSRLLEELTTVAKNQGINTDREHKWPKAANKLSKRLNELKTNMATIGIHVERGKGSTRTIILQKVPETIVSIAEPSQSGSILADTRDDPP